MLPTAHLYVVVTLLDVACLLESLEAGHVHTHPLILHPSHPMTFLLAGSHPLILHPSHPMPFLLAGFHPLTFLLAGVHPLTFLLDGVHLEGGGGGGLDQQPGYYNTWTTQWRRGKLRKGDTIRVIKL